MADVNCPNCGKRLRFSDTSEPVRMRCPACKHTFRATAGSALTSQTSPVPQSSKVSDYTKAGLGRFAKTAVAVTALAGTALLIFLVYKVASRPGQNEKPPQQLAQAVKTPENAWAAMLKKDWRSASEILIRLRKSQPDNHFVWFASGFLHTNLGNYDIAIQHYKQAIALKPDYAEAYCFMGTSYYGLKRKAEAIAAFNQAIALKPDYAEAYYGKGIANLMLGRYKEAVDACKQAIAIKPDYAEAYYQMGNGYQYQGVIYLLPDVIKGSKEKNSQALAAYEQAIGAYKQAIVIKPDYADAYYRMGDAYRALKKHAEAIEAYKKAIALNPDHAAAYYRMGQIYEELGQRDGALDAYQESLRLQPTGTFAGPARGRIRRLGGK